MFLIDKDGMTLIIYLGIRWLIRLCDLSMCKLSLCNPFQHHIESMFEQRSKPMSLANQLKMCPTCKCLEEKEKHNDINCY
jgi:hypothetical protein